MFKLVIQDDEGKTTVVPLIRDEITIGRKEGNTIRLTERNVSRRHARILRNNGEVHIEDLGSYNGIRVNNARIAERVSLRVSDQVQIGDYKLYLKAEGVEQVDDARTMPIERIDQAQGEPTEVMAANGNGTPIVPSGVPPQAPNGPIAASGLAGQVIGNPNRTLVAISDTDPAGRPVATAAAVAALTTPVGYGKLVVLSSNFASKEFELSRPQMIIGRTDENDIVINHRSISRNHAKIVRETDTGRYTISDLQSSNGVRVNGQDYGKVELRRGDVVDLGHVRLRFVEPGEDFIFSRDAVITDVPETGSKRGLLVAIVLGILVLGGVGIFFLMKGDGDKKTEDNDRIVNPGSGTGADNKNLGSGSDDVVVTVGSGDKTNNDANPQIEIDAGSAAVTPPPGEDLATCLKLKVDRDWAKLGECANDLKDPQAVKDLKEVAVAELRAELTANKIKDLVNKADFKGAKRELDKIPGTSVYKREASDTYQNAADIAEEDYERKARAVAGKNCSALDKVQREATAKGVGGKAGSVKCDVVVAVKPNNGSNDRPPDNNTKPPDRPDPPDKKDCDAAALKAKGEDHLQTGMDAAALMAFESALKCKYDGGVVRLAFLAACRSKQQTKAKYYFPKLPAGQQAQLAQICIRSGISVP